MGITFKFKLCVVWVDFVGNKLGNHLWHDVIFLSFVFCHNLHKDKEEENEK